MSIFHYHGICVTNQPHPKPVLGCKELISTFSVQDRRLQNEQHCQCEHGETFPSEHRHRHNIRLRKIIFPALLVLLALCDLLAWSCVNWHGWSTGEVDSLVGRDPNDGYDTTPNWLSQHAHYLIFLIFLVVLGALGWCCWRFEECRKPGNCGGNCSPLLCLNCGNGLFC